MDEVHYLRTKYAADVCVLLFNKYGLCGRAKTIQASNSTAFCAMKPSYGCKIDYTAAHEIGHLIGCRHNYSNDLNLIPYMYGHGYVYYISGDPTNSWRTIMSYSNECDGDSYCRTIPYWSNPNVYYNGVATGSNSIANNARVWNERAGTVSVFKETPQEVVYGAVHSNPSAIYEHIQSQTLIYTSDGYEIQAGQTVFMNANTRIVLGPQTHIRQGAYLYACINNETYRTGSPIFVKKREESQNIDGDNLCYEKLIPPVASKFLRDGQIFILRDGKTYTITGQRVE
ncbi:MAG: hypothetical protein II825_05655 [Paludibacteraceae bacterium]|nr:hypothetical protein [Paludibacteraceae bacterium]